MRILFPVLIFLFCFASIKYSAQTDPFTFRLQVSKAGCVKGWARLDTLHGGTGPVTITWSTGLSGTKDTVVTDLDTGWYQVLIKDTTGKDSTVRFRVDGQECPMNAPEAFSPNGDGINDYWSVSNYAFHYDSGFLIEVFSRWGQKVFVAKNEFEKWDGKSFGLPVPDGTYYYIIEYNDNYSGKQMRKGSVTIMR